MRDVRLADFRPPSRLAFPHRQRPENFALRSADHDALHPAHGPGPSGLGRLDLGRAGEGELIGRPALHPDHHRHRGEYIFPPKGFRPGPEPDLPDWPRSISRAPSRIRAS